MEKQKTKGPRFDPAQAVRSVSPQHKSVSRISDAETEEGSVVCVVGYI